jgi:uncharacterized protein YchJ
MLKDLPDDQFFALIFTSEDQLGVDYIEEAKRRKENMVPFLSRVLTEEKNYQLAGEAFWGVVHAVHLLGILGDPRGFHGLLSAGRLADVYKIDWIWEALPESYLRLGKEVIPLLMVHVEKEKTSGIDLISSEVYALWNFWDSYLEEREKIEVFLLKILKDPGIDLETRAELIGDFALINRTDLKPLFEAYFEKGEVDLDTLTRDDLDIFYEDINEPPGHRCDLEAFYTSEGIEERRRTREEEDQEREQSRVESFILANYRSISRNDACPCGSGKKFKKCHLRWAEEELLRSSAEEKMDKDSMSIRDAVTKERSSESALRRLLARKGKTALFSAIKDRSLGLIKAPTSELATKGFNHYFGPILEKIEFENKGELQEFMDALLGYHNALAAQFPPDYPRDRGSFH